MDLLPSMGKMSVTGPGIKCVGRANESQKSDEALQMHGGCTKKKSGCLRAVGGGSQEKINSRNAKGEEIVTCYL